MPPWPSPNKGRSTCFTSSATTLDGGQIGLGGVHLVHAHAVAEGRRGIKPLTFPSFPNVALVNTQSDSHGITDSAAGGTALATGRKTYNNAIGVLPDSITPITSIAVWAKDAGAAVGIATSVSVDHATPACFYAHQKHRKMYAEIGRDLRLLRRQRFSQARAPHLRRS